MMKNFLTAGDLMVIVDTLNRSLNVSGNSSWTKETRQSVLQRVLLIMEQMNAKVICDDVQPEEGFTETGCGV
jgi:hypothetical protein